MLARTLLDLSDKSPFLTGGYASIYLLLQYQITNLKLKKLALVKRAVFLSNGFRVFHVHFNAKKNFGVEVNSTEQRARYHTKKI